MQVHENHYIKRVGVAGIRAREKELWQEKLTDCMIVPYH
nr:MAG TPA: hypothetical protein [Caudoviricetes sp.]